MFSRFRMNLIVEIQGSDWDRRWLIAASGTVRCVQREVERKTQKTALTGIQFRTVDSSDHRIQLPAWREDRKKNLTHSDDDYERTLIV